MRRAKQGRRKTRVVGQAKLNNILTPLAYDISQTSIHVLPWSLHGFALKLKASTSSLLLYRDVLAFLRRVRDTAYWDAGGYFVRPTISDRRASIWPQPASFLYRTLRPAPHPILRLWKAGERVTLGSDASIVQHLRRERRRKIDWVCARDRVHTSGLRRFT
jgi:hypothetical protein